MNTFCRKMILTTLTLHFTLCAAPGTAAAQANSNIWTGDNRAHRVAADTDTPTWMVEEVDLVMPPEMVMLDEAKIDELLRQSAVSANLLPWENVPYSCGSAGKRRWDFTTYQSVGTPSEMDGGYYEFTSSSGQVTTGKFVFAKPVVVSAGTSWEYTHPKSLTGQCKATAVTERTYWMPRGNETCEYLENKVSFATCEGALTSTTCAARVLLGCEPITP